MARRSRGADFSQEDVEVVAPYDAWRVVGDEPIPGLHYEDGVIVECKHRSPTKTKLPMKFKELSNRRPSLEMLPILVMGDFVVSWMDDPRQGDTHHRRDFDIVWRHLVCQDPPAQLFLKHFYVEWEKRSTPGYIEEWYEQANQYCVQQLEAGKKKFFPLLELHNTGEAGRIMLWKGPFGVGRDGRT